MTSQSPYRAERFGTDFREPAQRSDLKEAAKKERLQKPGFATGIDLFTQARSLFVSVLITLSLTESLWFGWLDSI